MITISDRIFQLDTKKTSMVLKITKYGDAELLHYGAKIPVSDSAALIRKRDLLTVNGLYPEGDVAYGIDDIAFAYSYAHRGDSRAEALRLKDAKGGVFDFVYDSFARDETPQYGSCAHSHGHTDVLKLVFRCLNRRLSLELWFMVFENTDVITRFARIVNEGEAEVDITAMMSAQYDLPDYGYQLTTFDGAWARERSKTVHDLKSGTFVSGARSGMSSAEHNPFFMVSQKNGGVAGGDCFGFNLIYSGNHEIRAEKDIMNRIRIQNGILRDGFCYTLQAGESFATPESAATFSQEGANGMSDNMHRFVERHIVRGKIEIPVMLNTWEAMYFGITESKIERIAADAAAIGFECLVVDDGWFGRRDDDTSSLGDWVPDPKKFPDGLSRTAEKIHAKGLKFGLWAEPEMISVDSDLYRAHPNWAVMEKDVRKIVGRNQFLLNLADPAVRQYLIETLSKLIDDNGIDYLKWDFNRRFAEIGGAGDSGSYLYRYTQGLYAVLDALTRRFPSLVIEGCAAGGGRFDLGILCFCPIVWTSDNTDPYARMHVQEGTLYGYPPSCMLCHVSASPNHQTGRVSAIETRIAVAAAGAFGAQMNVGTAGEQEKAALKDAIIRYKQLRSHKNRLFYRLVDGFESNVFAWQTLAEDRMSGTILIYNKRFDTLTNLHAFKLYGLDARSVYRIDNAMGETVVTASGETLTVFGFLLPQIYQGNERRADTVVLSDNTAAAFTIRAIN